MKQFWGWKRILALVLATAAVLSGALFIQQGENWFGRAGDAETAALEYPKPDAIAIAPHAPNPPEVQTYDPDPADFLLDEATGTAFVKGIAVVLFQRGVTLEQQETVAAASGGEVIGKADMIGKWQLRVPAPDYAALMDICTKLEAMPGVNAVFPDRVLDVQTQALPSEDPWYGGYVSESSAESNASWAVIDRLPEAWEAFNGLAENPVQLGMVDDGVNSSHEELNGGIVQNVTSYQGFDGTAYNYSVSKTWHGTAVAGVLAGRANNGKGGAGVAWNANVYAVDRLVAKSSSGRTTDQVLVDGVLAVVRKGANAVNFSIGMIGASGSINVDNHGYVFAYYMWQMLEWGWSDFVVVQSAGNEQVDSINNGFFCSITEENSRLPADQAKMVLNRVIVAGGLTKSGAEYRQVYNSAYGSAQAVYAPSLAVFAPGSSTINNNSAYQRLDGTSMAAPQIAATAGWMYALNPELDGGQIGQLLKMDAVSPRVVRDNRSGHTDKRYRMLDCMRALQSVHAPYVASLSENITVSNEERYILVPEKTTTAALAAALDPVNGSLVYEHAQAAPEQLAGTGDEVKVKVAGESSLEITYTLVVKGDLSGDGRVDALDAQCLLGRIEGTWQPSYNEQIYTLALDGMDAEALFARGME